MAGLNTLFAARAAAQANPITNAGIFLRTAADNPTKVAALYFPPVINSGTASTTPGGAQSLRFRVHAWGTAVTSVTSNFQAILYYGVSATAASNTAMITLTNRSYASATGQWTIDGDFVWDNRTQKIQGIIGESTFNLTTLETVALITPVSSVDLTVSGLGLSVGALFGTTGAGNIAYMDGFFMEVA